jgi:hypothetical protein
VAHIYNPSYSGDRDQEDCSLKPDGANSLQDPILKKNHHKKRAGGVAQGIGPEFKICTTKTKRGRKKKKKEEEEEEERRRRRRRRRRKKKCQK